jgi:hypothetical protein
MTAIKSLLVGLTVAALLATPVMAGKKRAAKRHHAVDGYASVVPSVRHFGRVGRPVPRVGTFAPVAPADGENCDVGDNPFIC